VIFISADYVDQESGLNFSWIWACGTRPVEWRIIVL